MEGVIGFVTLFAGNFAPTGWAFCEGQELYVSQYQTLAAIIGNQYGGNGYATFNLPDLRGRSVIGAGQGPELSNYVVGQDGGAETVALTNGMINHNHKISMAMQIPCNTSASGSGAPENNVFGYDNSGTGVYSVSSAGWSAVMNTPLTTSVYGSDTPSPVATRSPYIALNYIICVEGYFPPKP